MLGVDGAGVGSGVVVGIFVSVSFTSSFAFSSDAFAISCTATTILSIAACKVVNLPAASVLYLETTLVKLPSVPQIFDISVVSVYPTLPVTVPNV